MVHAMIAEAAVTGAIGGPVAKPVYDEFLKSMLEVLIFVANLAGGIVIAVATVRGLVTYAVALVRSRGEDVPKEAIRISLGKSLSLALEFQLGADILGTALDPSIRDLITLGAIAFLRTVLNYFLGKELEAANAERAKAAPASG